MLSKTPIGPDFEPSADTDKQILISALIAELDAVSAYRQLAANAKCDQVKELLNSVAEEEAIHAGEFRACLLEIDRDYKTNEKGGEAEFGSNFGIEYDGA